MKILDYLCDDLLLIVPSNLKDKIIKTISKQKQLFSLKVIDDKQLKELLCFTYDILAINYISENYNVKLDVAKEYIENLYFIENIQYKSDKLNKLVKIKQELLEKNLIKQTNYSLFFKNKKIIIYGFDVISKEFNLLLKKINAPYEIVNEDYQSKENVVFSFETLEEEVDAICNQICLLVSNGVDINKIKLANVNDDYHFTLKRYFKMYNIALNLDSKTNLNNVICVKEFLSKVKSENDLDYSLKWFLNRYPEEYEIYNKLVNLCNKVVLIDSNRRYEALRYLIKQTSLTNKKKVNCVECIDLSNNIFDEDEHIFVMSINQTILPKTYKDEDYLSDIEKNELRIDDSCDLNIASKQKFSCLLRKSNNLILSYKKKTPFASFTKSFSLIEENIDERKYVFNHMISYSKEANELKLAKKLDNIYKEKDNYETMLLSSNYDIDYKQYSNEFVPFSGEKIKEYMITTKKALSYSAISNFFACGFRYFLSNILNIGKKQTIRSSEIGTVFHKVLEESIKENFDFETVYQNEALKVDDIVTRFYLDKLKDLLKDIIEINKENLQDSRLNNVLSEKKVVVKYNLPIPIEFKGFIDRILYTVEDDKTYVAIIDFKTGNPDINIDKIQYGLSLQLPIYLYLLKHTSEFKNVVVCGFYLQKLLPKQFKADQDYRQTIKDNIALTGYSNSSFSILSMLDPHFEESQLIKSMRLKKDGTFGQYAKVLSSEEMDDISNQVEQKIQEALNMICDCDFEISPKVIKGINQSCRFCEFKECCFVNFNNYKYLDNQELSEEGFEMVGDSNGN